MTSGRSTLLEREGELEAARSALARATGGEGGMLVFVGPAGIGKSDLLSALIETALEEGITTLRARGTELERDFAFGVARQLFEPMLAGAAEDERAALLEGAASLAAPLVDPASAGEVTPSLDPSFASLHGLYWLTANLAAREPLLIAVDDAHWADRASLGWLVHLAARLEGVPALLAVAIREPEPGLDEPLVEELIAQPGAELIRPPPLSESAVGTLISEVMGPEPDKPFAAACHASTAGNPFLTQELLSALALDGRRPTEANARAVGALGPGTVARSVLGRIARLPDACLELATALAVLGDGTRLPLVAELAGLSEPQAAETSDELALAGILRRSGRLEFAHPIVAAAVRSDLAPRRRQAMHREAARLVAEDGGSAARVAVHLLPTEPGSDPWVSEQMLKAGGEAAATGALDQAGDYLGRALRELGEGTEPGQRAAALSLLGWVEAVGNEEPLAIEHLTKALNLTEDPLQRAMLARGLSSVLVAVNRYVEAFEVLDRAIGDLPEENAELGISLEGELCVSRWLSREARRRHDERPKRFLAQPDNVASGLLVAADALDESLFGESAAAAVELARTALFDGRLLAAETADSPAFYEVIAALHSSDELELGREVCEQAVAEASERGSLRGRAAALCWRAAFDLRLGRIEDSLADTRSVFEVTVSGPLVPVNVANLIEALRERGELDAAASALVEHDPSPHASGEEMLYQYFRLARLRLRLARGEIDLGLEEMDEYEQFQRDWGWPNDGGLPWRGVCAELKLAKGDRDEARRLAREELEHAREFGALRGIGIALRASGLLEEGEAGIELLRESVETLAGSPARLEHARSLVDLGAAIRRSGARREAREPLNDGLALARRCGALALAERAFEELRAAGARPRKILRAGVEALTPSEGRIARMAAEGKSNRQIAQALFVTVRTVETHLHHGFQKLDIASRTELPRALGDAYLS